MNATDGVTERPLVSVVIPTRNRCRQLTLALRSALGQRDVTIELLVVDDGSQDATSETVANLGDPRVRLIRNDSPEGESGARNRGIAQARGEWIAFLDDDDVWAPDKLRRQLEVLLETGRQWAYSGEVMIDRDLHILCGAPPPSPEEVMEALPRHNSVPAGASNVIASATLLARAGPFDRELRRTADWEMWLRLARLGPPACACAPLVAICIHPGNMSRDMSAMFTELEVLTRRHGISVDRARHYRWAAWGALQADRRWDAIRYYAAAVRAGDLWSAGRAAVALVRRPNVRAKTAHGTTWTSEARAWVDDLARHAGQSAFHRAHGHD